ncbi:MAG: hypothetical protein KC713_04055 [Candidatus Omnitrophica bacterium]|nr:hypothetical protein [Candidatus Omnitrophota bacterium]
MKKIGLLIFSILLIVVSLNGCSGTTGNIGQLQSYEFSTREADWIRNGEPIEFEDALWYPADGVEVLMDNEMILLGEYQGVQFFVEKMDVRPYERIYTKYGRNQFRFFEKKKIL